MREELRTLLADGARRLGVELDEVALDRFSEYLGLLRSWGRTMNLTARLEERDIVTHHFLDSLAAAAVLSPAPGDRLVDIGTGAGFPGLPLKIAFPGLEVLLLDSVRKKVSFCRQVIRTTGLGGIRAEAGRADEVARGPVHAGRFRWATARAFDEAGRIAELALPFLEPAGEILIFKGKPGSGELEKLEEVCGRLGLAAEGHSIRVPGIEASRSILVVRRIPR